MIAHPLILRAFAVSCWWQVGLETRLIINGNNNTLSKIPCNASSRTIRRESAMRRSQNVHVQSIRPSDYGRRSSKDSQSICFRIYLRPQACLV